MKLRLLVLATLVAISSTTPTGQGGRSFLDGPTGEVQALPESVLPNATPTSMPPFPTATSLQPVTITRTPSHTASNSSAALALHVPLTLLATSLMGASLPVSLFLLAGFALAVPAPTPDWLDGLTGDVQNLPASLTLTKSSSVETSISSILTSISMTSIPSQMAMATPTDNSVCKEPCNHHTEAVSGASLLYIPLTLTMALLTVTLGLPIILSFTGFAAAAVGPSINTPDSEPLLVFPECDTSTGGNIGAVPIWVLGGALLAIAVVRLLVGEEVRRMNSMGMSEMMRRERAREEGCEGLGLKF